MLLSSKATTLFKLVFPAFLLPVMIIASFLVGLTSLTDAKSAAPQAWVVFPVLSVVAILVACFICFPLKYVTMEGSALRIRGLWKEALVPLSEVASVSGSIMQNPETITVRFKCSTVFGSSIKFMPSYRVIRFKTHPTIVLLRGLTPPMS